MVKGSRGVNAMRKVMFIVARPVDAPEAYEGKTNAEIEKEILEEMPAIPYVAKIEKVMIFDMEK